MRTTIILLIFGLFALNVCGQNSDAKLNKKGKTSKMEKQFIKPKGVFPANGYSHAISVSGGRTIYIAGQIALDEKGQLVGKDDIRVQTQQVFENIKRVLAASGASFADVVKFTYFVKNLKPSILPAIREIRDSFLPKDEPPPTSSLIGVEQLFRDDVLIEVECVAVVD